MKVLLVEDDKETADFIISALRETGYVVDYTSNGEDGLFLATRIAYDVLIIDIMLPTIDGLSVIKELRKKGNKTPIIILSALSDVNEKVEGLRAGADDYLAKPFSILELLARIEALIRRRQTTEVIDKLQIEDLIIDLKKHKVYRGNKIIELTPQEFKILEYLARHSGQVVTRTMLLESVWDYNFIPETNIIDVHISRLRSKIDRGFNKQLLKTVRGVGYRLE